MELYKDEMPQGWMVKIIIWFPKVILKHVFIGWLKGSQQIVDKRLNVLVIC